MYIVIELQTNNGQTANIVQAYEDYSQAESRYHQILASAATSEVDVHAACIMNEFGQMNRTEYYTHQKETEPEEPNETEEPIE